MKINKILACLLASVMFAACSDDDTSWNSGSATVSMEQEEIAVKENKGIFNVPVVVEGTQNGPIQVTVEVAETGTNAAKEDVNYIVTSKTILIPEDATSGNIEICTVDDNDINDSRTFTVSIVSANGAQIGSTKTTAVELRDNDAAFYEKLQGTWTMTTAEGDSWKVSIVGYDEGESGYDKVLYITGAMGYSWTAIPVIYNFDMATQQGSLTIPFGELFAEGVEFTGIGSCDVYTAGGQNGQNVTFNGSIAGSWNNDFNEITFDESKQLHLAVCSPGGGEFYGYWDYFSAIKLTR